MPLNYLLSPRLEIGLDGACWSFFSGRDLDLLLLMRENIKYLTLLCFLYIWNSLFLSLKERRKRKGNPYESLCLNKIGFVHYLISVCTGNMKSARLSKHCTLLINCFKSISDFQTEWKNQGIHDNIILTDIYRCKAIIQ